MNCMRFTAEERFSISRPLKALLIGGLYDASGVLSQIAAELSVKATISFLGYSFPETHELRKLLSVLSSLAMREEIGGDFARKRRGGSSYCWRTPGAGGAVLLLRPG